MVTGPTRGSLTSRGMISARTRCICDSNRCSLPLPDPLPGIAWTPASDRARHFHAGVALDLVTSANVLLFLDADTAFGAGAHFVDVVLEATQGLKLSLEDHHAVAQHADRIVALHRAFHDQAACNHAELAGAEHVAHLGHADDGFL